MHNPYKIINNPRLKRIALLDTGLDITEKVANGNYAIIGCGTVGYHVLEQLVYRGAGLNFQINVFEDPNEKVEAHNVHSAFGYGYVGQTKVEVAKTLVQNIDPSVNVAFRGIFTSYYEDILPLRPLPDIIVSAFDHIPTMMRLHRALLTEARKGYKVPKVVIGTDAGLSRTIVQVIDYNRYPFMFGRRWQSRKNELLVNDYIRRCEDPGFEHTKTAKEMSLLLVIILLGIHNLPHDLISAIPRMSESYGQHPGAGGHVGNDVAEAVSMIVSGQRVKAESIIHPNRLLMPFPYRIYNEAKDRVFQLLLHIKVAKLRRNLRLAQ